MVGRHVERRRDFKQLRDCLPALCHELRLCGKRQMLQGPIRTRVFMVRIGKTMALQCAPICIAALPEHIAVRLENFADALDNCSAVVEAITNAMRRNCYGNWAALCEPLEFAEVVWLDALMHMNIKCWHSSAHDVPAFKKLWVELSALEIVLINLFLKDYDEYPHNRLSETHRNLPGTLPKATRQKRATLQVGVPRL